MATWFGAGYLPKAPGTWGSLAALPFAWGIFITFGWLGLAVASAAAFMAGLWSAGVYLRESGTHDPGPVVIDEVAGQWLTLLVVPADLLLYAAGFVFFRMADILKPWPASWADRKVSGPLGVMLDDVLAAAYAAATLYGLRVWLGI
ncbi:MAG TPA: phosphatidylglycerophosphatase A [Rhodospirillales bacterium]|nr:phosphatidylglycerophosphatase A [Rhodospirillales bacterium]